ncbi:MAG TPA: hypothetical protein VF601_06790 [Beijerinckiaceae bacterium]|jgi:hypothetical protein
MSGWEFYFYMLVGPLGMFALGITVYFLTMPRESRPGRSPAE